MTRGILNEFADCSNNEDKDDGENVGDRLNENDYISSDGVQEVVNILELCILIVEEKG